MTLDSSAALGCRGGVAMDTDCDVTVAPVGVTATGMNIEQATSSGWVLH